MNRRFYSTLNLNDIYAVQLANNFWISRPNIRYSFSSYKAGKANLNCQIDIIIYNK